MLMNIAQGLANIPPQLATLIIATLPIAELRGALPIALTVYKLPLVEAIFWSILGNILPVYFLLALFERASSWLQRNSQLANQLLGKLYERTHIKLRDKVEKYGEWALILFVGIPLPVTGAWTGSLAAFVFGLNKKKAFVAILAGLFISSAITTLVTLGAAAGINALSQFPGS